ncbi:protein lin-54 homolog [Scaptodrosophila lebanonensis]|uniref:Protein lin-54 homolog n=1 Tax=Drosophila lebanonensis TaxID=7225 RepID=A0A6J2TTP6_DROLE|nr:protein lin-54 homolog [Scaptodrosophila lebanonensis]
MDTSADNLVPLDDTTTLPEFSFDDLLETKQLHTEHVNDDDDEEFVKEPATETLNTKQPKISHTLQILENKRLPTIKVTASTTATTAATTTLGTRPLITDIKVLKPVQGARPLNPITLSSGGTAVKIAGGANSPSSAPTVTKGLSGVTQIKTSDGRVIFLQKAPPKVGATATASVAFPTSTPKVVAGKIVPRQPLTLPTGIQKAMLSKGVTIAPTGLVKAGMPSSSGSKTVTIKGITPIANAKVTSSGIRTGAATTETMSTSTVIGAAGRKTITEASSTPTTLSKMPIQMVRTADGKLIKLNTSMVLSKQAATNSSTTATTTTPVAIKTTNTALTATTTTPTTAIKLSPNNVVITKKVLNDPSGSVGGQVAIKTPTKESPSELHKKQATTGSPSSSSPSTDTTTTTTTSPAVPAGKMLLQSSTGKQIVVANKNIIKLSPKPGATGGITNTSGSTSSAGSGAVHAIQVPGKSCVQYVRVMTNKVGAATPTSKVSTSTTGSSSSNNKVSSSGPQKVTLVRPGTSSGAVNSAITGPTKFMVKQAGGNIIPLSNVQGLMSKRLLSSAASPTSATAGTSISPGSSSSRLIAKTPVSSLDAARKHKLSDLNVQLKQLTADDASDGSDAGPDAKKARYVLMMQKSKQQQQQKMLQARAGVQRATVQGAGNAAASSITSNSSNAAGRTTILGRKVYNLVKTSGANGVKYMICNSNTGASGVPRTLSGAVKRPLSLAEAKQQLRFKHLKAVHLQKMQGQQKMLRPVSQLQKSHQQQQQQLKDKEKEQKQKQQQQQQQLEQSSTKPAPVKPLFDILKPAGNSAAAAAASTASNPVDALGALASRRKHCNCSKSQCLKLYCDCFANGEFCQDCTCKDCYNNLEYEDERQRAIRSCLDRNPSAFKPKITARDHGDMRLHNKGCNCKRSGCLKNYCECYEAKIPCSSNCKCVGCRNMEDRPDVDLDSLDAVTGEINSARQSKSMNGLIGQENRTNAYLTDDVVEATIMCMISRIVMDEKQNMPLADTEREVMEELGESLNQIILFAKDKNDTSQLDDPKSA